ncbi:MAG: DUF4395 family protein [Actinomycetota bacterium]
MQRTAHPYQDTEVIDARAPRFNQATVGLVCLAALVTGWWFLVGLMAAQLIIGLRFGRRYCLPCAFYFEVIQPRFGEGEIEDARPPRFANIVGAVFLSASTGAHVAGLATLGWALAGIVAALALFAAATGICVGCELYRFAARLRGVRPGSLERIDLGDLGVAPEGDLLVQFSHPLCTGCRQLEKTLRGDDRELVLVDVSERSDLARKYHVAIVPTAVRIGSDGRVLARLA